jgi:hypothetical protein
VLSKNDVAKDTINEVPVPDYAHKTLLELFHNYAVIGGMPEIVDN